MLPAGCGMTPTELALNNFSSLCWSEFGVALLDAEDLTLPKERADGEATAPPDCLDGVTDRTGRNVSSRLARSSSSKKSEENRNICLLKAAYTTNGMAVFWTVKREPENELEGSLKRMQPHLFIYHQNARNRRIQRVPRKKDKLLTLR